MDELARLLTLLALVGVVLTVLGGVWVWALDPDRRTRKHLARMLGAEPRPMLIAPKRGAGIGFDLAGGAVAVAWDAGGWGLAYRLDELLGVELIVDDRIAARAHRGEGRRPLDQLAGAQDRVRLRFVFDDLAYPDFELDLWLADDEGRRGRLSVADALQEANRWLGRIESLLRRTPARTASTPLAAPLAPVRPAPLFDLDLDDEADAEGALN